MIKLTNRLKSIADMVQKGERIADVGCDHGYIPVYLVGEGISPSAVACDINKGPLNSCSLLVKQYGLENKIKCVLSDGLKQVSSSDYDTVIIAGMGGELIADILSREKEIRDKRLILNPMTHPELARKWLFDNGFTIDNDIIVPDGKYHYSVFTSHYTGEISDKKDIDYFLGNIKDFSDKDYFLHLLNYLSNKQKSGFDYSDLISKIKEKL